MLIFFWQTSPWHFPRERGNTWTGCKQAWKGARRCPVDLIFNLCNRFLRQGNYRFWIKIKTNGCL